MKIVKSINGVSIRLTAERFSHIINRHPEMKNEEFRILSALSHPDYVQDGDAGTLLAVKFFQKTPLTDKNLVVVYKEISNYDGFIVTAYFTGIPAAWRKIIWKR